MIEIMVDVNLNNLFARYSSNIGNCAVDSRENLTVGIRLYIARGVAILKFCVGYAMSKWKQDRNFGSVVVPISDI